MTANLRAIRKQFREDVRYLLSELGARELARKLKTSTSSLYEWAKAGSNPRIRSIEKVLILAEKVRSERDE